MSSASSRSILGEDLLRDLLLAAEIFLPSQRPP